MCLGHGLLTVETFFSLFGSVFGALAFEERSRGMFLLEPYVGP